MVKNALSLMFSALSKLADLIVSAVRLIVFDLDGSECMMDVGVWRLERGDENGVGW